MNKQQFESGKAPNLTVSCRGDLQIRSWLEASVLAQGETVTITESDKGWTIESSSDLRLMVPEAANINVREVHGDMLLKNISGQTEVQSVNGDAALQTLGPASITSLHGDLSVQNLDGGLEVEEVMGDVHLRNVATADLQTVYGDLAAGFISGTLTVQKIMGDLSLKTVSGNVNIAEGQRDINLRNLGGLVQITRTYGDIRLRGGLAAGKHQLQADGDIVIRWPADAPLLITAQGAEVHNELLLEDLVEEEGSLSGRLNDGETVLALTAGGRVLLKEMDDHGQKWAGFEADDFAFDFHLDFGDLGSQISSEINKRVSEINQRVAEMTSGIEEKFGPEFAAKVEMRAQKAAARAEQAAQRARRQAERAARRSPEGMAAAAPTSGSSKTSKATEAEQLKILKMVEAGTITPEEASTLLEALES